MDQERRIFLQQMAWMSAGVAVCGGCRSAPITGRKQLLLMPEDQEVTMGLTAYQEIVQKEPPSSNERYAELVNRVGGRIAAVAERSDYDWEFRVLASEEMNAFCLPGGKVAVYEGIIPVCGNEAGLAVVMSHEIAHALARHGGERMSQNYAVDGVRQAVSYVLQTQEQQRRETAMRAFGVATEFGVLLPYSRKHESEADQMGLMLMAKAGYDPAEAPRFWQRFGSMKDGAQQPEFLSTHPSDDRRARDLLAQLPDAQNIYQQASRKHGMGQTIVATQGTPAAVGMPAGFTQPATQIATPFNRPAGGGISNPLIR